MATLNAEGIPAVLKQHRSELTHVFPQLESVFRKGDCDARKVLSYQLCEDMGVIKCDPNGMVDLLNIAMTDDDCGVRCNAIRYLGFLTSKHSVPRALFYLIIGLEHSGVANAVLAAELLIKSGADQLAALIPSMNEKDQPDSVRVFIDVIQALESSVPIESLGEESVSVKRARAVARTIRGVAGHSDSLCTSEDPVCRAVAVLGDPSSACRHLLCDAEPRVRELAVLAIRKLIRDSEEMRRAIESAAMDEDVRVRVRCVHVVEKSADLPLLIRFQLLLLFAVDDERIVSLSALRVLSGLKGEALKNASIVEQVVAMLNRSPASVDCRPDLLRVLAETGRHGTHAFDTVMRIDRDDKKLRFGVCLYLRNCAEYLQSRREEAVGVLSDIAEYGDKDRCVCIQAIGRYCGSQPDVIELLERLLATVSSDLDRVECAVQLAANGSTETVVIDTLLSGATAAVWRVRQFAVNGLKHLARRDVAASEQLKQMSLEDENLNVREAASHAIRS